MRNRRRGSLELRRYARKGGVELTSETIHYRNDRDGDTGGQQAVFNGRRSGLILHEPNKKLRHVDKPWGLPSSPGRKNTHPLLSVSKFTYRKLGKSKRQILDKKAWKKARN